MAIVATSISWPKAAIVASSASAEPLVATMTGSKTIGRSGCSALQPLEPLGDLLGGEGAADHADLHRVDADVGDDRVDLREDHFGRDRMDGGHAERVLRGDRGDRGHRMAAEHGDRLDVGLDARAAAGIRAGDDEDARGLSRSSRRFERRCGAKLSMRTASAFRAAIAKKGFTPRSAPPRKCRRPAARPAPDRRLRP